MMVVVGGTSGVSFHTRLAFNAGNAGKDTKPFLWAWATGHTATVVVVVSVIVCVVLCVCVESGLGSMCGSGGVCMCVWSVYYVLVRRRNEHVCFRPTDWLEKG